MGKRGRWTGLFAAVVWGILWLPIPAWAANGDVRIPSNQLLFYPRTIVINQGDTVTWHNAAGGSTHTATSDDGSTFNTGSLAPGSSASFFFQSAGIFP